jgi:hypothetical protein
MAWSLRARKSGVGSDSRGRAGENSKQITANDQRVDRNDGIGVERHPRTAFA